MFDSIAKQLLILSSVLGWMVVCQTSRAVTVDRYWEFSPYQLHVAVVIDLPQRDRDVLESAIEKHIRRRIGTSIGAIWRVADVSIVPASRVSGGFESPVLLIGEEGLSTLDKLHVIEITRKAGGIHVTVREHDFFAQEWGHPRNAITPELAYVPELSFRLMTEVFAPIATYRTIRGDVDRVTLSFKGSSLPAKSPSSWTPPGSLLAPILRRIDNSGKPVEGGIERVKWTYLEAEEAEEPGPFAETAFIFSHTKSPFRFRQRGRVEQLALLIHDVDAPTTLRLYNKNATEMGLPGYDVFLQNMREKETRPIGKSDDDGQISIKPGPTRIQTAYVKSGSIPVAKIPIAPGDLFLVEAPLPDHRQRITAEAKLAAIQEDLIDLVAQRTIMSARIERHIKRGEFDDAKAVLEDLDALPTASQFELRIDQERQIIEADDPVVEMQINKLFSSTKSLLGRYLDATLVTQLRRKIAAAESPTG